MVWVKKNGNTGFVLPILLELKIIYETKIEIKKIQYHGHWYLKPKS